MLHRILAAALILLGLFSSANGQRPGGPLGPGGPLDPGGREIDLHPEDPVQVAERTRRSAERAMQKAQEYREKGRLQQAAASYKSAITYSLSPGPGNKPVDAGIANSAIDQLKQLYDEGKQKLDAARKLYEDGKYLAARDAADKVKKLYGGILSGVPGAGAVPNLANLAIALIREIETDPKAIPILQQDKAAPLVKRLARLDREAQRDASKRLDIYQLLQKISEKYPKCDAGQKAADRLIELRKDDSFLAWVQEETESRHLRGELALAEQYSKNGQTDKADAIHEKLLRRYPGKTLDDLKSRSRKPADLTAPAPHD